MSKVNVVQLEKLRCLIQKDDNRSLSLSTGSYQTDLVMDKRRYKRREAIIKRFHGRLNQYSIMLTGGDFDKWSLVEETKGQMIDYGAVTHTVHIMPNIPGVKTEWGAPVSSEELLCKDKEAYQDLLQELKSHNGFGGWISRKNIHLDQVTCSDCLAKISA